eukprot:scaffold267193_cov32-Tisochrysis_lutea.AAC.1
MAWNTLHHSHRSPRSRAKESLPWSLTRSKETQVSAASNSVHLTTHRPQKIGHDSYGGDGIRGGQNIVAAGPHISQDNT